MAVIEEKLQPSHFNAEVSISVILGLRCRLNWEKLQVNVRMV